MVTYNMWNLTAMQNLNGSMTNAMLVMFRETSRQTNYLIGTSMMIALWLIIFFALRMKGNPSKVCIATASWALSLLALLIYPLQIIPSAAYIVFLMLTPLSVLALFLMGDE
jgi:hypothetical protein